MRSLGDPAFFRIFDALVAQANPPGRAKRPSWSIDGTDWRSERHTFSGASHNFTMEICTIVKLPPNGWTLLVVKEFWWIADQRQPLRDLRWAKLTAGSRAEAMNWLRKQERDSLAKWPA
jgi:hypothetical protein